MIGEHSLDANALVAQAERALEANDYPACVDLVRDALAAGAGDPQIESAARAVLARAVPGWHFPMMRDEGRNRAFADAIERAVRPGMKVLDIGSGSGLLAMMAARAGAQEVHSCEVNPVIAELARGIVQVNGFADRITVHNCNSNKLDPDAHLGGKVDLVVSEIIGKDLVCENVLPTMHDAVRRLAKPGAQFIPQSGEILIALAHLADLERDYRAEACGFDLSPLTALMPATLNVKANAPGLLLRGEPVSLFDFDFTTSAPHREHARTELVAAGGAVNGIVQWFRLQMDADGLFENPPGPASSQSWGLTFVPLATPREMAAGERIAVAASVTANRLRVWEV